jgi:hypothetical protein
MSQRGFLTKEYKAFYDDIIRDAAHQYLAMIQLDVGRNQRLIGCLVGLNKRRQEMFVSVCMDVSRHCDTEIMGTLLPIYTVAGRLYHRFKKDKDDAKIAKLKRQMTYFNHTRAIFMSLQESAHVVIDAYYNQYDALVTRSLAPELSDEERDTRSEGPTRIPVDEDRLDKIRKRKHAASDRVEKTGLGRYDEPKSKDVLERAFKSGMSGEEPTVEDLALFDEQEDEDE